MSLTPRDRRLANEYEALTQQLSSLQHLVELEASVGTPPKAYRLQLCPFGFLVREGQGGEPTSFDPTLHGKVELVLSIDASTYPYTPWSATLLMKPGYMVFNPHVGVCDDVFGAVCWLDGSHGYRSADWPVQAVLPHVLRILTGEIFVIEGYSLNEDAKIWFKRSIAQLPFARVPDSVRFAAQTDADSLAGRLLQDSALGIEVFREARQ